MASKPITIQDYSERVNKVLEYINNHLDEKLDLNKLAELCNFSSFHFHRLMRAHLNESLMAYVIRLRMESAAILIRTSDLPLSQIAYKVGYDVPSSFSKAFKKRFNISPQEYKTNYIENNHFIKNKIINSKIYITMDLKPKIKTIKPKKVVYVQSIGKYGDTGTKEAWEKVLDFVKKNKLFGWRMEFIGISHDDPNITEPEKLRYNACITITKDVKPQGEIGVKTIEGGKYAVFLYKGPYSDFQEVYNYIYREWLTKNKVELRDSLCYEKYLNSPDKTKPENLKTEICIPIS